MTFFFWARDAIRAGRFSSRAVLTPSLPTHLLRNFIESSGSWWILCVVVFVFLHEQNGSGILIFSLGSILILELAKKWGPSTPSDSKKYQYPGYGRQIVGRTWLLAVVLVLFISPLMLRNGTVADAFLPALHRGPGPELVQVAIVGAALVGIYLAATRMLAYSLFPLSLFYTWKNSVSALDSSVSVSTTDWWLPWLAISTAMLSLNLARHFELLDWGWEAWGTNCRQRASETEAVWLSFAILISSYFWSGVKKLGLGDTPIDWIANNPTNLLVRNAQTRGLVPLFGQGDSLLWSSLVQFLEAPGVVPALNMTVVLTQLFTILSLVLGRRVRALVVTIMEIEHFAIFVLTGIFFWKWALALFLFSALISTDRTSRPGGMTLKKARLLPLLIGLSFAPAANTPILGWWDSPLVVWVDRQVTVKQGSGSTEVLSLTPAHGLQWSLPLAQGRDTPVFLDERLHKNAALGARTTRDQMEVAVAFCASRQPLTGSKAMENWDGLDDGGTTRRITNTLMQNLANSYASANFARVSLFPHHIFSSFDRVESWQGLGTQEIVSVTEFIVIYCQDDTSARMLGKLEVG